MKENLPLDILKAHVFSKEGGLLTPFSSFLCKSSHSNKQH